MKSDTLNIGVNLIKSRESKIVNGWWVYYAGNIFSRDTGECRKTIVRFKYQPGLKGRKWIFRRVDKKKKREKKKTGIIGKNKADNKLIFTGLIWMSKRTVCIRNPFIGNNDQNMSKYKKHVCWLAVKLCLPIFEYIRVLFSPLPDIFI